jgi:hypothetical protein
MAALSIRETRTSADPTNAAIRGVPRGLRTAAPEAFADYEVKSKPIHLESKKGTRGEFYFLKLKFLNIVYN